MPTFDLDGTTIHYGDSGTGKPILMLHASGSSGAQWQGVAAAMPAGFRSLSPDNYGHGRSGAWPGTGIPGFDGNGAMLVHLLDMLGLSRVDLVGHSFGGALAVRLALDYPGRVGRVVLIEPMLTHILDRPEDAVLQAQNSEVSKRFRVAVAAGDPAEAWRGFIDLNNVKGTWDSLPEERQARFLALTDIMLADLDAHYGTPILREHLASLALPCLTLRGETTRAPIERMVEIVAETVPGSAFGILEGAGHMAPLSHPEDTARMIAEFLRSPTIPCATNVPV